MTVNTVLEELKNRNVVLFVADEDEINPAEVPFPVVFTGMGKMRMFSALVKWHESLPEGSDAVVLNIGSAGSAKYPIGTIVNCTRICNGGCELVEDCIVLPGNMTSSTWRPMPPHSSARCTASRSIASRRYPTTWTATSRTGVPS